MTILVTGATGFLGSALTRELIKQQQTVRVLVRDQQKARTLFGDAVTLVAGDITDAQRVREAVEGVETIYHMVGHLYHPSVPGELFYRTHVEGTRILLEACKGQKQLQRFVHCSTTGVHGITGKKPAAEDAPYGPTNPYEVTKLESEILAMRAHQEQGLPVSVVRPGMVYGPGDLHLLGFFTTIKNGKFPVLIAGGKALIHPVYISDMTAAFLLCAQRSEAIGRSYNIAGAHPVSFRELAEAIAHALGQDLKKGSIPLWLANTASDLFAVLPGFQGERAPLTRSRVKFLTMSRIYSIERARQELGYKPAVGLEEGMSLTALWYQKHGYL
ncbi:NAD-dependent epimerase/dehydratase family protein [Ktedonosporobacter rubrisoli]|uniref:NAD-dependent epimerase/dehydratase family protein n=1 Tax=Ktedonosporobacter rubrisoli TaxID=2509675 RepID=A0A4P6JW35_KTERU|nr:NAD-dependent epimerase/dehydratase family protein [Ktedonosporobacter rubrisoli]QBD79764.1 NAD-dependent epimerase/dehydratase family protein [Ktedonosporobacter rubrisoli]